MHFGFFQPLDLVAKLTDGVVFAMTSRRAILGAMPHQTPTINSGLFVEKTPGNANGEATTYIPKGF
jgi:hypothetical protein